MTTTIDAAETAIVAAVVAAFPTTPLNWPNSPFSPPLGQLWLDCDILWGRGTRRTMQPEQRNVVAGTLHVNVYSPQSVGDGAAKRLADEVRTLCNRGAFTTTAEDVRWHVPSGSMAAREERINSGIWWVVSVSCPFEIEELAP